MAAILTVAIDTDRSTWTIQYMFYNMHHTSGSHYKMFFQIVKKANKIKYTWGVAP